MTFTGWMHPVALCVAAEDRAALHFARHEYERGFAAMAEADKHRRSARTWRAHVDAAFRRTIEGFIVIDDGRGE